MSKALLKYIRLSPTKARLIAREIQGMNAELALATLEFAPNKAAKVIYKVLASAIANGNYDAQSVVVKSCRIDAGPVLRRMSPRARGRANMIRKPTAHILVEVDEPKNAKVESKPKLDSTKAPKKATKPKKVAESKNAESSKKITPKATKAPKDSGDSSLRVESKSAKTESKVVSTKELNAKSKADSNAESKPKPKAKKPSATKTAKTTTSEDK